MWKTDTTLTINGVLLKKEEFHETHTAQVILTKDLAFKRRRPVSLFNGLIEYETLAQRWEGARNECLVGRRISPEVYRGIYSLVSNDELRTEPRFEEEPVVVMERLPSEYRADVLFSQGASLETVSVLAQECAAFHIRCERQKDPAHHVAIAVSVWQNTFRGLPSHHPLLPLTNEERHNLMRTTDEWLERRGRELLYRRALIGRVVEGHGDLQLKHVYLKNPAWTTRRWAVIDPLEFSRDLRRLDVGAEIGFLAMELDALCRYDAADFLVEEYARLTDDCSLREVVMFFRRYRAVVRALVAWETAKIFSEPVERTRQKDLSAHYFRLALSYALS